MRRVIPGLLAICAGASPLLAQSSQGLTPDEAPQQSEIWNVLHDHFSEWQSSYGEAWHLRQDRSTGYARMLFGGSTSPVVAPQSEADWFTVGRHAVQMSADLHGVDGASLVEDRVHVMPLGLAGTTDKVSIQFRQVYRGIPVVGGWMNIISSMEGGILAIDNTGMPELENFDTTPRIAAEAAVDAVARWFVQDAGSPATEISGARLVIDQIQRGKFRVPVLTWEIQAQRMEQGIDPAGWVYRVDAMDGTLANRETMVHHLDVSGTVSALVTPGTLPDTATNPEQSMPMPNMTVSSSQGNAVTDLNGNFTIVGATSPVNVTVTFDGPFHIANNQAQADYSLTAPLNFPVGNNLTMNPGPNDLTTPEGNSFLWVNNSREWIKFIDPGDTTPDFPAISNLNLPSQCNAFFNGSSINFYPPGGGCVNTAYSTVVSHELGHWYQVLYGTGNGSDGMGEGGADVWAMYTADTAIVGEDFFGTGGGNIRDGNNLSQYWGDSNGCSLGGVHACGQVFMGAFWKMMVNLRATHGQTMGRVVASTLYVGWQNGYNQTQIKDIIVDQLMTLDDNDGNINNGTPNSVDINNAFMVQGFTGFTPDFMSFSSVTSLPDTTDQSGPYTVDADIVANINPSISSANLHYSLNGGGFAQVPMTNTGGSSWTADIPGQPCVTTVDYYLSATDSGGNTENYPEGGAAQADRFLIGNVQVFVSDDFDTAGDNGWTHSGSGQDDWNHMAPSGACGDPAAAVSGVKIWGNDLGTSGFNSCYQSNVDNFLDSPVFDCSGCTGTTLSFKRWLRVESGQFDQAQIFVNGTQVWVNPSTGDLLDSSWTDFELDISAIADGNPSVQVQFRMTSDGGVTFGGWNIDDFQLRSVDANCGGGVTYCQGKINSNFCLPFITSTGAPSATSTTAFRITGNEIMPLESGFLIYSLNGRSSLGFHNGTLCVKTPFTRLLPPKNAGNSAGGLCSGELFTNFNNRIQGGADSALTVGQQVNAQWYYRDPGVDSFNDGLTDGIEFTIQP